MVRVFMGLQRVGRSGGGEGEKLPDVSAAPQMCWYVQGIERDRPW